MDRIIAAKVFVAVADRESMTSAGEYLGMTTPMVSRYLASLENWLNTRLVHRTTRKISLTAAGEAALESCRELLILANNIERTGLTDTEQARGSLRIAMQPTVGERLLLPLILDFQRDYPSINVNVALSTTPIDMSLGRLDISIRNSEYLESGFITQQLGSWPLVISAAPSYLKKNGVPSTLYDLNEHRFIAHQLWDTRQRILNLDGKTIEFDFKVSMTCNDETIMRGAAVEGAGLIISPSFIVQNELNDGTLVRILPTLNADPVRLYAAYSSNPNVSAAIHLMLDRFAGHFANDITTAKRS